MTIITMKKPKLGLPPSLPKTLSDPAMQAMINKGGSVLDTESTISTKDEEQEDKLKSFTFKIYESELAQIRGIQDKLPKRDRISIHDFVLTAVKDKIRKESR